jgi:hypothetical protein
LNDVRGKGQLLEGLHLLLELVLTLRVKLRLRQLLLHAACAEHHVDIVHVHLLARLTEAHELLTEARDPLTNARRLLLRTKTCLDAGQTELRSLQTEVARRLRTGLCKLLGAQAKATTGFRRTRRGAGTNLAQLTGCLCGLKRAVCSGLKSTGPHLCGCARLLLKDVPLQLLFCNSLTGSTESSGRDGLPADLLLRELALTADVSQGLLDCGVFKGAHELHRSIRGQPRDALPCSAHSKVRGFHELALRFGCRGPRAVGRNTNVKACLPKRFLARRNLARDLPRKIACAPE